MLRSVKTSDLAVITRADWDPVEEFLDISKRGSGFASSARAPQRLVQSGMPRFAARLLAIPLFLATLFAKEPVRAQHAMVVAEEAFATDTGVAVLKAGGNAVDAAISVGFALAVTHPFAGNLGGGGFMLERRPEDISLLDVVEAIEGPMTASLPLKASFPDPAGGGASSA